MATWPVATQGALLHAGHVTEVFNVTLPGACTLLLLLLLLCQVALGCLRKSCCARAVRWQPRSTGLTAGGQMHAATRPSLSMAGMTPEAQQWSG